MLRSSVVQSSFCRVVLARMPAKNRKLARRSTEEQAMSLNTRVARASWACHAGVVCSEAVSGMLIGHSLRLFVFVLRHFCSANQEV